MFHLSYEHSILVGVVRVIVVKANEYVYMK